MADRRLGPSHRSISARSSGAGVFYGRSARTPLALAHWASLPRQIRSTKRRFGHGAAVEFAPGVLEVGNGLATAMSARSDCRARYPSPSGTRSRDNPGLRQFARSALRGGSFPAGLGSARATLLKNILAPHASTIVSANSSNTVLPRMRIGRDRTDRVLGLEIMDDRARVASRSRRPRTPASCARLAARKQILLTQGGPLYVNRCPFRTRKRALANERRQRRSRYHDYLLPAASEGGLPIR